MATPFPERQQEFGRNASQLLTFLCDPTFDEPTRPAAYQALGSWQNMEDRAWEVHDTSLPGHLSQVDTFRRHWIHFHVALPFSEAEREWMAENMDFQTSHYGEIADQLGHEARIVSAGVHKVVAVHELIHRWLVWRQEADEFSGQGTLDQARSALAYLIRNVTPDTPLPQAYIDRSE